MLPKIRRKHNVKTTRDIYNFYLETLEPGELVLGYEKWKKIVYEILYRISKAMIQENLIVKLDANLGYIGVEKAQGKVVRRIDFGNTRKLGRTVFHSNLHTDCYYFKFVWRRRRTHYTMSKNITLYKFVVIQDQYTQTIGKRGLAAWIKKCSTDPYIKDYDAPTKIVHSTP